MTAQPPPSMPPLTGMPPTASESVRLAAARPYPLVDARCTHFRCNETNVYRMVGRCTNCQHGPLLILITAGHDRPTEATCPKCRCREVSCDRLAEDDEIPADDTIPAVPTEGTTP